jgi:nucleoside-diphosphate-sugar epimerase
VGFLDDDPAKFGKQIHGYRVIGATPSLERIVSAHNVEQIVIAMPSAESAVIHNMVGRAEGLGIKVRVVPGINEMPTASREGGDGAIVPPERIIPVFKLADLQDSIEVKKSLLSDMDSEARARRILVTGGAGYIGSFLVRRLLDQGYMVRVLDNFTFGDTALAPLYGHPRLEVVRGDISSIRDVVSAVKDVGSVVALAAIVGDPACGLDAEETLTLNFESTKVLTEACNFYGVDRLVFASSCSVYGASDGLLTETSPLNPVSLYARTRIMSENVIFDRCGDVTPVVLRLATVFGLSPRMRFDLVVNTLTVRGVIDGSFQVFAGNQWRPFVHCQDAAEAFCLAVTAPKDSVAGQIFNVGSNDMNFTISQVGDIVASELRDVEVENIGEIDDPRNYRVSFDKIHRALGFDPQHDLRAGIREMANAIRADAELQNYRQPHFSNLLTLQNQLDLLAEA